MRDRVNGKNSVLTPQPVTDRLNKVSELHSCAFVSPKGMVDTNQQEFITNLNSTNAELAGFDSLEEPNFTSTKSNAHATIIPISNAQPRGARDHQNTARVPNSASQGRVLPTWTGKAREKFQLHTLNSLLGKKKREAEAEGRQSSLPSKCQQTFQGDSGDFIEVVEAVDQPRQVR